MPSLKELCFHQFMQGKYTKHRVEGADMLLAHLQCLESKDRRGGMTTNINPVDNGRAYGNRNIVMQHVDVTKEARSQQKAQKPCVIWLTGLSGAGKSTIANLVEKKLFAMGQHTYLLDGDNVRHGLNKDLGFKDEDRVENIRRVSEVAKLMVDAGLIVISAFISPFRTERDMAREMVEEGEFVEVFVNTSLEVAEGRDVKGLYRKARRGELKNFTGIDSPYEEPTDAEYVLNTNERSAEDCANQLIQYLVEHHYL